MTNKQLQKLQFRNQFMQLFRAQYSYVSVVNDLKVLEKWIDQREVKDWGSKNLDLFYDYVLANGLVDVQE